MGLFDFFKKKETKETPKPEKENNSIALSMPMFKGGSYSLDKVLEDLKSHWGLEVSEISGDDEVAAHFHVARTVVRRAERRIVSLAAQEDLNPLIQKYVNRLSDLMFVLARYSEEVENKKWKSTNLNI